MRDLAQQTRTYRVDTRYGREATCYFADDEPHWARYLTHSVAAASHSKDAPGFRTATPDEIAAFESKEAEIAARRQAEHDQEAALLALCGLSHDDFVRFRSVYRDGEILHVSTRENGANDISVNAIRNATYSSRENDEGDSTYANYVFKIPGTGGDNA